MDRPIGTAALLVFAAVVAAAAAACGGAPETPSYVDRMSEEHRSDAPVASGAASGEPAVPVLGEEAVYGAIEGRELRGYLARPEAGYENPPAVIVVHEWWGLNDNIRAMSRRFAGEGYVALAIDVYGGRVAETPEEARDLMQAAIADFDAIAANVAAAADYLRREYGAPRVGIVGWCFGGSVSLESALRLPERIDAAVMYYGSPVLERERIEGLRVPLLGLFGEADQGIPVDSVRAFEAMLAEMGKDATIRVYPHAGHAFANPSGRNYRADVADDAWSRTTAFFDRRLRG